MNKQASIYVDVELCNKWGVIGGVNVYLNGVKQKFVSAAKSGANGFIEVPKWDFDSRKMKDFCFRRGYVPTKKVRGNVKVVFNVK